MKFLLSDLRNDIEIGEDEYDDIDAQNRRSDLVVESAASVLTLRERLGRDGYPFSLDEAGARLTYIGVENWGRKSYLLSLFLSHLATVTDVLGQAERAPDGASVRNLRNWFQQMAAAILAAELRGMGWAFGWPRPDHTNFHTKMNQVWRAIGDGTLHDPPPQDAPQSIKDCEIDVVAARPNKDQMPGFQLAMAQVATGANWKDKSVRTMVDNAFFDFWFSRPPASQRTAYHIIPFVLSKRDSYWETLRLGHILSRLRLCQLAHLAESLIALDQITSEGTDAFANFNSWAVQYRQGRHFG
ncbi:MAG: hypothetical protein VR74_10170 [Hyphomonas sp. BRH_c22]|nr:MAG: hypothetical protein VR74_10170 [Hyphomonas sp. BRH_c22]